jgi:hypothetical protein
MYTTAPRKQPKKRIFFTGFIIVCLVVGFYQTNKALPVDISYSGSAHVIPESQVEVFYDRTFMNAEGERQIEQEIFDEILRMISESSEYVLVDMFLFNDFLGVSTSSHRSLTEELTNALIAQKEAYPDMTVQVITDPINVIYGGHDSIHLNNLKAAGVSVVLTDLTQLRDSNPIYSTLWRTVGQWWGNSTKPGLLPNPFSATEQKLSMRSYLQLLNFKANHRKVIVADYEVGDQFGLATLVTSANPHDGSSAHSNIAVRIDSNIWHDVLVAEAAVADFSGVEFTQPGFEVVDIAPGNTTDTLIAQLVTEKMIKTALLGLIRVLEAGDTLDMAMFYIADRDVVAALKAADTRGVQLRLLFDPNKDAFGREKGGLPNRQVAHELMSHTEGNTVVRWCVTNGEQCHSKLTISKVGNSVTILQGSANLTRRNLDNYNLETNMLLQGEDELSIFVNTQNFFDTQWGNEDGEQYSVAYIAYADDSLRKTIQYRLMEWSGLSSW